MSSSSSEDISHDEEVKAPIIDPKQVNPRIVKRLRARSIEKGASFLENKEKILTKRLDALQVKERRAEYELTQVRAALSDEPPVTASKPKRTKSAEDDGAPEKKKRKSNPKPKKVAAAEATTEDAEPTTTEDAEPTTTEDAEPTDEPLETTEVTEPLEATTDGPPTEASEATEAIEGPSEAA